MASNWSANVVRYGLGCTGATLCARALVPIDFEVIYTNHKVAGRCDVWVLPPDTALDSAYSYFTVFVGDLNFPYGADVEPD